MTITNLHKLVKKRFGKSYRSSTILIPEATFEMSHTLCGGHFSVFLNHDEAYEGIRLCLIHVGDFQFIIEADPELIYAVVYSLGEQYCS